MNGKPILVGSILAIASWLSGCQSASSFVAVSAAPCGVAVTSAACNDLQDVSAASEPICTSGTVPTGTGGEILDGTYVLSASVYYDCGDASPPAPSSATIEIENGCVQEIGHVEQEEVTASGRIVTSGNELSLVDSCLISAGGQTSSPPSITFTATDTSLTLFYPSPFSQYTVFTRVSDSGATVDAAPSDAGLGSVE